MKPPVPYFGGKITVGPTIAALLPAHAHYVEPYCGSLAVLLAKTPSLECLPALEMIRKFGADPDVLLYVDPPYLGTTRGWDNAYRIDMRAEVDHRVLADALHAAQAAVVLSGYPSDLYDRELYPGWDRHTIAATTGQGGKWEARTEVLWSNRPLGHQPQLELWPADVEEG